MEFLKIIAKISIATQFNGLSRFNRDFARIFLTEYPLIDAIIGNYCLRKMSYINEKESVFWISIFIILSLQCKKPRLCLFHLRKGFEKKTFSDGFYL